MKKFFLLAPIAFGLFAITGQGCSSTTNWGGSGCDDACPGADQCDTALGCVECLGHGDCGAAEPFCVLGRCRECEVSGDCGAGQSCYPRDHQCHPICDANGDCQEDNAPFCDPDTGACVGCIDDLDCGGDEPFCDPFTAHCVECLGDGDCGAAQPFCQPGAGECRECIVNAHCGENEICDDRHCRLDGPCASNSQCPDNRLCDLDTGDCVRCLLNSDCNNDNEPYCSAVLDECVECLLDEHCPPDKICNNEGKCD